MVSYITFKVDGRFGNNLFQYLFCKIFTIKFGHVYIPENEFFQDSIIVNDENAESILKMTDLSNRHIYCKGYFQKSEFFIEYKKEFMDLIYDKNNSEYWVSGQNNTKIYVYDYLNGENPVKLNPEDVVISLRLDDFIQLPCKTSDILPPQYYLDILEKMKMENKKVYIVCDRIKYDWERKYVEFFNRWNPILLQNTLIQDIAFMRECNILLHSNSTLCWITSFLSNKTIRYIPKTNFYVSQSLDKIDNMDALINVRPLDHSEVYDLNPSDCNVVPLSFSIPDECVVESVPEKEQLLSSVVPGITSTYIFGKNDEQKYYDAYRKSRFALTKMKGGWDCLRHYEILMNGCIPLFDNLNNCPKNTMTTYPKHLNDEAYMLYNSWKGTRENINAYNILCEKYLEHTRAFCTTSQTARYFLKNIKNGDQVKNILLICGNSGLNYSRELTWIGLKRHIQSIGGTAVEYSKLHCLYDDYDIHSSNHFSYTFSKRLRSKDSNDMSEMEIIEKIKNKFWDLIIFGKVGPDEGACFPLFDIVKSNYNKNKIAFIFGGDEIFNLKITDKTSYHINMHNVRIPYHIYVDYLNYYKKFGTCFVRELEM